MYQALYRKYRPSNFNEVVGQDVIVKTISNAISNNRISHAYLLTGPRGTGKTSIAKIMAKTINCDNLKDLIPCDKCVSCTQINNHTDVDIIEIDAASNNGVDEIRELKNKVNLVPANSKYKVYIIDEVHMLTTSAFNALLKTLEEPPPHIIFILATTDPHKITETILSRCQRFDFRKINIDSMYEKLNEIAKKEKISISKDATYEIARLSDGGMRDAISTLDKANAYATENITIQDIHDVNGTLSSTEISELITSLVDNDMQKSLNLIDKYNNRGKNIYKLCEDIVEVLKNTLIYYDAPKYLELKFENTESFAKLSKQIAKQKTIDLIKKFNDTLSEMPLSNNPKLLMELIVINSVDYSNIDTTKKEDKKKYKIDQNKKKKIDEIKNLRINNALSKYTREEYTKVRDDIKNINKHQIKYSLEVEILSKSILKAASAEYLVFISEEENIADYFNENLIKIEELIETTVSKKYRVIATSLNHWEEIRKEFNDKKKTYKYIEEEKTLQELIKQ